MANPTFGGLVELGAGDASLVQGGAVAPLVVMLLVPLVGAVATAVDLGYVTHTGSQIQNAGGSAALAGGRHGAGNLR